MNLAVPHKPRLRGVSHYYGSFLAVIAAIVLVVTAPVGRARLGAAVFGFSVAGMLGASALLHRGSWSVAQHRRLTQLDHTMIFCTIAGTYTPILLLGEGGPWSTQLLVVMWAGATAGIVFEWLPVPPPRGYVTAVFITLGWVGLLAFPGIRDQLGSAAFWLILGGGLLYTGGAVVHALRRPDPWPHVFGYHEIWHLCVLGALVLHYVAIGWFVLPEG